MTDQTLSSPAALSRPVASRLSQTIAAFVFGALILFAVGFSPLEAAHNAAHDVRHTLAFPCH